MPYRPTKKIFIISILVALIVVSCSGCSLLAEGQLWFVSRSMAAQRLEQTFPFIEQQRVSAYRNQNWCKNMAYKQGLYSDNIQASTCNLFSGTPQPFNDQADQDFAAMRDVLNRTSLHILYLDTEFGVNGKLQYATFQIDCWLCSRRRYVYSQNYGQLPIGDPEEMWYTAVNKDWYIREEE